MLKIIEVQITTKDRKLAAVVVEKRKRNQFKLRTSPIDGKRFMEQLRLGLPHLSIKRPSVSLVSKTRKKQSKTQRELRKADPR